MLPPIKRLVLTPHQTVQAVRCRVRVFTTLILPQTPRSAFRAQVQDFFQHAAAQVFRRPITQAADSLRHHSARRRVINGPHLVTDFEELFLQILDSVAQK